MSDSPTAAREELEQRKAGPDGDAEKNLKKQAAAEEKAQKAQLAGGKAKGAAAKAAAQDKKDAKAGNMAQLRDNSPPAQGRVDNMTRRDDNDVDQGHFCVIDYGNFPAAKKAVEDQLAPKGSPLADQGFEAGVGSADYGVYLQPGSKDEDGYPTTATVLLRDEYAAQVVVPYESLKPATAGGRR